MAKYRIWLQWNTKERIRQNYSRPQFYVNCLLEPFANYLPFKLCGCLYLSGELSVLHTSAEICVQCSHWIFRLHIVCASLIRAFWAVCFSCADIHVLEKRLNSNKIHWHRLEPEAAIAIWAKLVPRAHAPGLFPFHFFVFRKTALWYELCRWNSKGTLSTSNRIEWHIMRKHTKRVTGLSAYAAGTEKRK